ncbi:MAG: response regulator transcription factor [Bacteroidota bacterium]|nr:response regulator transcription factor [Bacteroidota bacterium]MDP4258378.1 response regulator transcription factor [Bacteroidota bacterium]
MQVGVVIYEDNNNLRESLCNLVTFSEDLVLLGHFPNVDQVSKQVAGLRPDVILMDIDMPGRNGIEAVREIRAFDHRVQIIMLTVFDDNRHVLDAICAGASGYLLKKYISDHLAEAISQVMQGDAPMSPGIARMVIQSMHESAKPATNNYHLTPREKEILAHLSKGNSYKLIAADFVISIDTVRTHIKNIYEKLKVHNQVEAVSKAANERLL